MRWPMTLPCSVTTAQPPGDVGIFPVLFQVLVTDTIGLETPFEMSDHVKRVT